MNAIRNCASRCAQSRTAFYVILFAKVAFVAALFLYLKASGDADAAPLYMKF